MIGESIRGPWASFWSVRFCECVIFCGSTLGSSNRARHTTRSLTSYDKRTVFRNVLDTHPRCVVHDDVSSFPSRKKKRSVIVALDIIDYIYTHTHTSIFICMYARARLKPAVVRARLLFGCTHINGRLGLFSRSAGFPITRGRGQCAMLYRTRGRTHTDRIGRVVRPGSTEVRYLDADADRKHDDGSLVSGGRRR